MAESWTSEGFHINADTCVDVTGDTHGVVVGQQGKAWLHNLHLTPDFTDAIADAMHIAAAKAREAGAQS